MAQCISCEISARTTPASSLERCPLEEAIELFEEGMNLVKLGRQKLDTAEKKISILLKDAGEFVPFADGGGRE